jgi:hypothetical protein
MTSNVAAACLSSHSVAKNLAPNCHNNKEALGKHSPCCKFSIAYTWSFFFHKILNMGCVWSPSDEKLAPTKKNVE